MAGGADATVRSASTSGKAAKPTVLPWERPDSDAPSSSFPSMLRPSPKPNSEGRKLMHTMIIEHGDDTIVGAAAASKERLYATTRFKDNQDYAAGQTSALQFAAGIDINRFVGLGLDASTKRALATQPSFRRDNIPERARLRGAWVPPRNSIPVDDAGEEALSRTTSVNVARSAAVGPVPSRAKPGAPGSLTSLQITRSLSRREPPTRPAETAAVAINLQPTSLARCPESTAMPGRAGVSRLPKIKRMESTRRRGDPLLSRLVQQDHRLQRIPSGALGFKGAVLRSRGTVPEVAPARQASLSTADKASLEEMSGVGLMSMIRKREEDVLRQLGVLKSDFLGTGRGVGGSKGVCKMASGDRADVIPEDDYVDKSLKSLQVKQAAAEQQAVSMLDSMARVVATAQHELHLKVQDRRWREVSERMKLLKLHGINP